MKSWRESLSLCEFPSCCAGLRARVVSRLGYFFLFPAELALIPGIVIHAEIPRKVRTPLSPSTPRRRKKAGACAVGGWVGHFGLPLFRRRAAPNLIICRRFSLARVFAWQQTALVSGARKGFEIGQQNK